MYEKYTSTWILLSYARSSSLAYYELQHFVLDCGNDFSLPISGLFVLL